MNYTVYIRTQVRNTVMFSRRESCLKGKLLLLATSPFFRPHCWLACSYATVSNLIK